MIAKLLEILKIAIYALWNNKGGVGKSYLTFQIAAEYAVTHPNKKVLVLDLCPQANSSSILLGGIVNSYQNFRHTKPSFDGLFHNLMKNADHWNHVCVSNY